MNRKSGDDSNKYAEVHKGERGDVWQREGKGRFNLGVQVPPEFQSRVEYRAICVRGE